MLIDTTNLNPEKTYHCNEIGTSRIARILQRLQHKKYPQFKREAIASHSFILVYRKVGWNVWENHLEWNGIKEYTLEDYEKLNANKSQKRIEINQYDFDLESMDYLRNFNPHYSVLDLGKIAVRRLAGIKLPNTAGQVCSESAANCGLKICNVLGIKSEYITPIDWMYYFSLKH